MQFKNENLFDTFKFQGKQMLDSKYHKLLQLILNQIINNQDSEEFRKPVPWKQLGLFNYLEIIKEPMDLSTVKRNLNNSSYTYIHQFLNHLLLIWQNCRKYNEDQQAAEYYNLSLKMEIFTYELILKHLSKEYDVNILENRINIMKKLFKQEIPYENDLENENINKNCIESQKDKNNETKSILKGILPQQFNQEDTKILEEPLINYDQKKRIAMVTQILATTHTKLIRYYYKNDKMLIYIDKIYQKDFLQLEKKLLDQLECYHKIT